MSTIGGMKIATKGSGHTCPGPTPAMSLIPPTPPAGPVPSPFAYIALSSSASKTKKKMKVSNDEVLVNGSQMDVQQPGNIPSNPTGGDVVTHMVNRACGVFTGSSKVKAGGKEVACTGDKCRLNMPMSNGMVAQTIGTLITADALRAAADPSVHAAGDLAVLDPISVSSGTVIDENVDLELPGIVQLRWVRQYSSGRVTDHTPMGRSGWTHGYHQYAVVSGSRIELRDGDGRDLVLPDTERGVAAFHRARRLEVTRDGRGGVVVRSLDTLLTRRFEPLGGGRAYLKEIVAPTGQAIVFEYEAERLARVIDTAGRRIELTHDKAGHIVRLAVFAAPPGVTAVPAEPCYLLDYGYGDDGELVSATDAMGRTEAYAYDGRRRGDGALRARVGRWRHPRRPPRIRPREARHARVGQRQARDLRVARGWRHHQAELTRRRALVRDDLRRRPLPPRGEERRGGRHALRIRRARQPDALRRSARRRDAVHLRW
jgi:YD repeat-containing protein